MFQSVFCPAWDLRIVLNLVSSPCTSFGLTALQLLDKVGDETAVNSIQRYNSATGEFETATYHEGHPVGVDFPSPLWG